MTLEEYQKLSEDGKNDIMFKLLIQEDYVDHGKTLQHGNVPIYCIKMPKNPRPEFTFETVNSAFKYLLYHNFIIAFSFTDEKININTGHKPVYFMYTKHYNKLHRKVKPYIEKIDPNNHIAFGTRE
jgi:hypothetical protein